MTFLLDTNICSKVLRDERRLFSRFTQYAGNLSTSRIVLAELYAWAHLSSNVPGRLGSIRRLTKSVDVLEFDDACAQQFGALRVQLTRSGITIPTFDLLIASTALVHDLTLVTHNVRDFQNVPGLRVVDWLSP